MAFQLSDNGKAVLLALIAMIGSVATLWIQAHNQHADRMAEIESQSKLLKGIDEKLENRKPLVFGK